MKAWIASSSALVAAAIAVAAAASAAPAPQLLCNKCKAIVFEGRVYQTCPDTSSGGDYCIIDGSECETVGQCFSW